MILSEGHYTGVLENIIESKHFIISTTQYEASKCNTELHSHKNPHLCFLLQGVDIECKKDLTPYQRVAGDVFFYRAGEKHKTIDTLQDSKNVNIEFKLDNLKKSKIPFTLNLSKEGNHPISQLLIVKMLHELMINDSNSRETLETMAFQLFKFDTNLDSNHKPKWVNQVDEYLNDCWDNDFSLIDLADAVGVHPITISKNFRRYYNCTYGDYRRMLKIKKSIPLIKNNKMALSEIAYACGFSDQSHFVKTFKNYKAFLPKDFRRA